MVKSKNKGALSSLQVAIFLLIALWVYASVSKVTAFGEFRDQLNLQVFGRQTAAVLVFLLPLAELSIAILLSFEITRTKGLFFSFGLLIIFTVYIALITAHFFSSIPCSCGGLLQKLGWVPHLFFNFFFLMINIWAIIINNRKEYR